MSECFVIQPFDNGKFDKRYTDTFEPAIRAAGLEPYRVDRDQTVNDLVQGIKDGIERSSAVLADLTLDNPNVWYELGHAVARAKPFCLICSDERTGTYPFDIGHLKIIPYKTGSLSDFQRLATDITARLKAVNTQVEKLQALSSAMESIPTKDGLDPLEQVALSMIFEEHLEGGLSIWNLKQQMEKAGFTKAATTLAVINLIRKSLVEKTVVNSGYNDHYDAIAMSDAGLDWVRSHTDVLSMTIRKPDVLPYSRGIVLTDEDIPF